VKMDINDMLKDSVFGYEDGMWIYRLSDIDDGNFGHELELGIPGDEQGVNPDYLNSAQDVIDNFYKYQERGLKFLRYWMPDTDESSYYGYYDWGIRQCKKQKIPVS